MKSSKSPVHPRLLKILLLIAVACRASVVFADRPDWKKEQVNWRLPGGSRIKSIRYPEQKPAQILKRHTRRAVKLRPKAIKSEALARPTSTTRQSPIFANVIESPPIDGFVPYIVVAVTDEATGIWLDIDAYPESTVVGNYLTGTPAEDYAVGILDTGASAHVVNAYDAVTTGLYDYVPELVTSIPVTLSGATGDVDAWVSQPLGIFFDGLDVIDSGTLLVDDSNMVGQSNVSVIVGGFVESPNLPTVIGTPLAVYFTTVIENNEPLILNIDGNEIISPNIQVYEHNDIGIPSYGRTLPLELRPADAVAVQFIPCEIIPGYCPDNDGEPGVPSTIWGTLSSQSLPFATRTDLAHGSRTSQERKFMFDTGAQITIISESQAIELELFAQPADFEVEIVGITGDSVIKPGYYIDLLEISAAPTYLTFTNVPVIVLNVDSPEGGILNGILGMNLFVDMDFYIHGGGLPGQDQPYIKFEFLPPSLTGDIAPTGGDGSVDTLDLAAFAYAWLANPLLPNWNSKADFVPDAIINFGDFTILARHWLEQTTP